MYLSSTVFGGLLIKVTSRKKGTLMIEGLLGNPVEEMI